MLAMVMGAKAPHRARSGPACSWLDQRLPLQASLIGSRLMATCGLRFNRSVSATRASRPLYPRKQTLGDTSSMSAFLIGRSGQALSDYPPPLQCRCRSRARASLRNRHQGPSIMGVEGEVEQSIGRRCRQTNGRSKRPNELTSSIVPRGTSFHRWVELECSPIAFDPELLSCRGYFFPGPAELGAVNPYAVHDHGQPACQRHDRLFHPAVPGDLHRPGLEP